MVANISQGNYQIKFLFSHYVKCKWCRILYLYLTCGFCSIFFKPLKPILPRKVVTSAKLNLNRYWHKFEELLTTSESSSTKSFFNNGSTTRTSYRLLPPLMVKRNSQRRNSVAPSMSPVHDDRFIQPNNIQDEITAFMAKRFTVEKNISRSSMYKHFNDESLYHGVNLNIPDRQVQQQRCNCNDIQHDSKYQFNHRNIQLSFEDKENLENEAMEVFCCNLGYETSF